MNNADGQQEDGSDDECNKVEVEINQGSKNFILFLSELIKIGNELNVDDSKAVITFKSKADAKNFIRGKKFNDLVHSRRLVKTVHCKIPDECTKVKVDIKTG